MTDGEYMREFRRKYGISRAKLARYIGVSPSTVYAYENGRVLSEAPRQLFNLLEKYVEANKAVPTIEGWKE